jgi:hypothetical protein
MKVPPFPDLGNISKPAEMNSRRPGQSGAALIIHSKI